MGLSERPAPVALLREATRAAHERVDAAFGAFGLDTRDRYTRFLRAHALALPAAEARMRALPFALTLEPRTPLLTADLADLGEPLPAPLTFDGPTDDDATAWGTLYVVEGSRLGGAMLAKMVPEGLPNRYLAAVHPPGQWRAIRAAIDTAGDGQDVAWRDRMLAGAQACFTLYARAAGA